MTKEMQGKREPYCSFILEQHNVSCCSIGVENLCSHPNQDAWWTCQHEMHSYLLACRKTPPATALCVCVCVCLVHVMDDRAVLGRSQFNCDVSACLWQPRR